MTIVESDFNEFLKQQQPYLTTQQILQLKNQGFSIGAHSFSHPEFWKISEEEQLDEIKNSMNWLVEKVNPDLVIYQAGADPHIDDPFGSVGLTNEQMFLRDKIVFEYFKSKKIPIFFVLAGGYQDMDNLVKLHVGTFKAASQAFETR